MAIFSKTSSVPTRVFPGAGVDQIKTGDFNGDGHTDFVVSRIHWESIGATPTQLQVYLGDGTGKFVDQTDALFVSGTPSIYYVPRMIIDDFNGDGVDDIFAMDFGMDAPPHPGGQNLLFLSANGKLVDATSGLPQAIIATHGGAAGDIDNDGDLDILINALDVGNELQINNGLGRFQAKDALMPDRYFTDEHGLVHAKTSTWSGLIDVDNDGWLDMIIGAWDGYSGFKTNQLFLNQQGSFANSKPVHLPISGVSQQIALDIQAVDLNDDALPDFVISITNGGESEVFYKVPYIQLLINKGDGIFVDETAARYPQSVVPTSDHKSWYKSVDVIDLNGDGHQDLLLDNPHIGPSVLLNNGHGQFHEAVKLPAGVPANAEIYVTAAAGDFNGDGMPDLVLSHEGGGDSGFDIYLNQTPAKTGLGKIAGGYDHSAIYRFFNTSTGKHFYTGNKQEVETVLSTLPQLHLEGKAFTKATEGTVDILRFYNTETHTHFYTASADEAAVIRATLPAYRDEGVAYRAYAEHEAGTSALYRFFNTETGTHFYTANEQEMESVKVELAGVMKYEGIAYYVGV